MGLTTDNYIDADGSRFLFPDNAGGIIATQEWVNMQGFSVGSPGIDDVLAEGQQLTTARSIDLNAQDFTIGGADTFRISGGTTYVRGLELTKADGGNIGMKSANGTAYVITVSDLGILVVTPD